MFLRGRGSLFVVIEGVDGSGKSTLVETLRKYFEGDKEIKERFERIIYCQEPSKEGTKFCEKIRNIVLGGDHNLSTKTRALMFLASRSDHMEKLIEPELLKERTLIICDRFYLSTIVYQGHENPKYAKFIEETQRLITDVVPDITFFLDISKEVFRERHMKKVEEMENNVMDNYARDKFDEIVSFYRRIMEEQKDMMGKIIVLNANEGVSDLKEKVKRELMELSRHEI